ncbi:hypothetical protein SDC9_168583 [bioreactor metagenome]|uniref:Uncharacterized protein n=1 Tax=bioreactor metagenome TaxID=1076179 RepID=A0A645GAV7_9ZZZZ
MLVRIKIAVDFRYQMTAAVREKLPVNLLPADDENILHIVIFQHLEKFSHGDAFDTAGRLKVRVSGEDDIDSVL